MTHLRILQMTWKNICFAHWRVSPGVLSRFAPRNWEIDTYEGEAWLSIVPFVMEHVRLRATPSMPGFRYVPELNVRTYIKSGDRRAVFFFSLDAASRALVYAARCSTGLPYFFADIEVSESDGTYTYISQRKDRSAPNARFSATYRNLGHAKIAEPGSLDDFLHERYLFVTIAGIVGRVFHEPYRLEPVELAIRENDLGSIVPYPISTTPDYCRYAHGIRVESAYEFAR